jgi:AcrR family transcriptional regulator
MERLERKKREFQAHRAEILDHAEKIFAAKGYHNVTVAEIASATGFSIGSLYQFFPGKENLYTSMISEKLDLMYEKIREEVNSAADITDKIGALIGAHFDFVEQNTDFCRLFLRGESVALSEIMVSLRDKLIADYSGHITFIENILKDGVKKGFLRRLNTRDMAGTLFGMIRASSNDWMLLPTDKSLNPKKDFIMEIFLQGVKQHEK